MILTPAPLEVATPAESVFVPPVRVFEITYVGGAKETVSAHRIDVSAGILVFIDEEPVNQTTTKLYYRLMIAAGQWSKVAQTATVPASSQVQ